MWNDGCEAFSPTVQASVYQKFLSSTADLDHAQTMKDGYKSLLGEYTNHSNDSRNNQNYRLTQCLQSEKNSSFWLTDSVIAVNMKYELCWRYMLAGWEQSTKRYSHILLAKENGEYKIHSISDKRLFTDANNYITEW